MYYQNMGQMMVPGQPPTDGDRNPVAEASAPGNKKPEDEKSEGPSAQPTNGWAPGFNPGFDVEEYMKKAKSVGGKHYQRAQEWYVQMHQWMSMMSAYRMQGAGGGQGPDRHGSMPMMSGASQMFINPSYDYGAVYEMYKAMGYPVHGAPR